MGADALSANDRTMILQALQDAATLDYEARIAVRQQIPFAKDAGYEPDYSSFSDTAGRVYVGDTLPHPFARRSIRRPTRRTESSTPLQL